MSWQGIIKLGVSGKSTGNNAFLSIPLGLQKGMLQHG
jgi:hypothetical protein